MTDTEAVPQHSLEAEQAVIGALMISPDVFVAVEPILGKGDAFYRPAHGTIYRALLELRDRQEPTDFVSLTAHMLGTGDLVRVGGANYFHECMAIGGTPAQAGHYAGIVASCGALRMLEREAKRIAAAARTAHHNDAEGLIDQARGWLAEMSVARAKRADVLWGDAAARSLNAICEAADAPDEPVGLPIGLLDVDQVLKGLRAGNFVLVAARPRVGKSVLLVNAAQHVAMTLKRRVLLCSLEMSEEEVTHRLYSSGASVDLSRIREPKDLDERDWARLAKYVRDTEDTPLHIDASANASVAHIRATAKRILDEHGDLALIIVDYLQLVQPANPRSSRQEQVSEISRSLKLLGKELGVPVIAACQLNRGPEQRTDKKPQLGDLRESGSLEQDSDQVILLHREDADNPQSPKAGECSVIIAKNRHGAQATVVVAAQLHRSRFVSTLIP